MLPDCRTFADRLAAALAAPEPAQRVNDLLRDVLIAEAVAWESDEQRLVRRLSERIDVESGDTLRLLPLARNVEALLGAAASNESVEMLLELISDRERVADVVRKYGHGTIGRSSFLSFVAEQRWPDRVRRRMAALTPIGTQAVVQALESGDIARLEGVLAI